jgi:hypothetical protein
MAGYGDGAANNGFGRRSLHQWEARLLYMAGYPLVRVSVEVGIPLVRVGIDAEDDGEEGAGVATADQGRSSGTLVIREGARASSSSMRGRKRKPKKENVAAAAASAAEAARAEDAAVCEAIAKSSQDLVPADNALPMDAALA